jgi:dGTPase
MPAEWAQASSAIGADEGRQARLVCDYIAGMTDRYAISEHRRIFGDAPDLR